VCRANDTVDQRTGVLTQKTLLAELGIKGSGNLPDRAGTLLDAGGFPRYPNDCALGSADSLVSTRRRDILDRRSRFSSTD
jgi:hypothetical protein